LYSSKYLETSNATEKEYMEKDLGEIFGDQINTYLPALHRHIQAGSITYPNTLTA
jgi:hypothetical protein